MRKHSSEEDAAPRKNWRVLFGSWASRGYSAMGVLEGYSPAFSAKQSPSSLGQ